MVNSELHKMFIKYGPIISLKISLNADHSSKGFGYITFEAAEFAQEAINKGAHLENNKIVAVLYENPKSHAIKAQQDKTTPDNTNLVESDELKSMIKNGNNLFIKNMAPDWNEKTLQSVFGKYGRISSSKVNQNDLGKFAFICFDDPKSADKYAGFRCADKAQKEMNKTKVGTYVD